MYHLISYVIYLERFNYIITLVSNLNYTFKNAVVIIEYLYNFIVNKSREHNMRN